MKKFLAVVLALAMVLAFTACGGNNNDTNTPSTAAPGGETPTTAQEADLSGEYNLTIWCPENAVDLTKKQVENFNSSNDKGIKINITVEPVSEADAATQMITDVAAGADLYFFAQDQLARLVQAGALTKLGAAATEFVNGNNSDPALVAAKSGSDLYAYPLTADNGYFMYYDKSVIPEADIDSLEKIIADCEGANKNISFELENAWYNAGFFIGTGCVSNWTTNDAGEFTALEDDWNSDKGVIAAKGIQKVVTSKSYVNSSNADFASGSAVVVTGTWNFATIKEQLGDNFGVADLPSFEVDGTSYHIGSYSGCKLLGVKPQEDAVKGAVINQLAQYLTSKDCQLERFTEFGWGPSNKEALADEAVASDPTLTALNEQNKYAAPQPNIHGSWWDIAKVISTSIKEAGAGADDAKLKEILDKYENDAQALVSAG